MEFHRVSLSLKSPCFFAALSLVGCLLFSVSFAQEAVGEKTGGVAVVELFTSQGCSSCPPADAVLKQIARDAAAQSKPVYAVSYHVDYWNRLGWTDPYSDAVFSRRQSQYAKAAGSRRVYTPQMIVNGTSQFNGSNATKAKLAITDALSQPVEVTVSLALVSPVGTEALSIAYEIEGETVGRFLNTLVVTTPKQNGVVRGENAGKNLSHVNVALSFHSMRLKQSSGVLSVSLSEMPSETPRRLIAFIQDPRTRRIVGSAAVAIE